MNELKKEWLTDGLIDFEYKKYILLAYLQDVKKNFDQTQLYPCLSDLVFHYQNLLSVKENKKLLYESFPKIISEADFNKLELNYKRVVEDDKFMQEIEDILGFALPQFKIALDEGKDIYEYVEKNLAIEPVGVSLLYAGEGYLFINEDHKPETFVYQYQITVFENANEKYKGVHLNYIETFRKSIGKTFENIKLELIKKYKELPNPATYLVSSRLSFPFNETLLPVTKRLLIKYISSTYSS